MERVGCLVVDDDHYFREGLAGGLRTMASSWSAWRARSSTRSSTRARPDVVLLDRGLPSTCRRPPPPCMARHSGTGDHRPRHRPDVVQAFGEGALAYLTRGVEPDELARAIRTVAGGGTYVTPALAGHLLGAKPESTDWSRPPVKKARKSKGGQ